MAFTNHQKLSLQKMSFGQERFLWLLYLNKLKHFETFFSDFKNT